MKEIIKFILFLAYTIIIFFIKDYTVFAILVGIHILLMLVLKINVKGAILAILKLLPIIIFTTAINIWISGLDFGMLIGVRLIVLCNMTYIYTKKMTFSKLQYVIEILLRPLKIIKIDSKEVGIMLCIGIAFVPIIQKEITNIKYSLKAKGFNVNARNILLKPNYILMPLLTGIIKRVGEIENSLSSKGYVA